MREISRALSEVQGDAKALKLVAGAYSGREGVLTAVLQYVYQTIHLGGSGFVEEGKVLERLAAQKLEMLEVLGSLIEKLGASAVFTACPPYPVSYHSSAYVNYAKTLPAMIASDIRLERALAEKFATISETVENDAVRKIITALHAQSLAALKEFESLFEKA